MKTRLQLQGRHNNPFFNSGYNYRSTWDAARTIVRTEGFGALYSGYKATIFRDLPFSALQFAFYEQEQKLAKDWVGGHDIGLGLEVATAVSAGGIAGVMTCPLDVVKTRTQTQIIPVTSAQNSPAAHLERISKIHKSSGKLQTRSIHSGPRTLPPTTPVLDTSSVITGLKLIYKTEGSCRLVSRRWTKVCLDQRSERHHVGFIPISSQADGEDSPERRRECRLMFVQTVLSCTCDIA